MCKLIVSANSFSHLDELIDKDIYGVILYIDKLSVNSSFYIGVNDINKIDFKNKKIYLVMNKIMHNNDLDMVYECLSSLSNMDVKILFYDMAVYNIAKKLDIVSKLVIYQDHLNASILSNNFYYGLGVGGSYITSDITKDELLDIKRNSNMEIYFMGYGYAPIFYSRRYLVNNYLKFIGMEDSGGNYSIISDMGVEYPIVSEEYGTTIYSEKPINLINYLDEINDIDYIVMNSNGIEDIEFNMMVDRFISREKLDDCYIGFWNTKTIFRVKNVD